MIDKFTIFIKKGKSLLFLLSFVILPVSIQAQSQIKSINTLEDKIYGLSLLWSELKYNFVNIDRLGFDLDSLYRETMKRVINTKDDVSYYKELDCFLNRFNDAHTNLFDYPDSGYEETDYPNYGTKYIGGKYYFIKYKKDCPYSDPDLLGAEIVEIDGLPTEQYVEKFVLPYLTGSTLKYRLNQAGRLLLNGLEGSSICGKAICRDGKMKTFNIVRNGEAIRKNDDVWLPEDEYSFHTSKAVTLNWKDDIAFLNIRRFIPESVCNDIDKAMAEINARQCRGVIIDLRGNGGGRTDVAWRLQMYLTQADTIRSFGAQTRINSGYGRSQGNYRKEYEDFYLYKAYKNEPPELITKPQGIKVLSCPVAILIDNNSFSACEDFLINIYEMPNRPVLIGEETAGSTGAPLVIELPHGAVARICTLRPLFPYSMKPFVEKGIIPDIEVIPTLQEVLKGKDVVMKKALHYIQNKN